MNINFILLFEFFKIGLFAIGGGYATLPFLYHLSTVYHWFNPKDLTQMLAIASIMPGPIGINLSAQAGFKVYSFFGAIIAVVGIMIPSLIFVLAISKLLKKFKESTIVRSILYALKPTSCAMVAAIGFKLLRDAIFVKGFSFSSIDWFALILFSVLFLVSVKNKKLSPLFYLAVSAFVGVFVQVIKPFIFG